MRGVANKRNYSVPRSLRSIRHKMINRLLFGTFIVAIIGAPISSLRALSTGWLQLYSLHIAIALLVVLVFIFRKKIPFQIKSLFLLFIYSAIGILGIFTLGILGAGVWWLIVSCFLVSILYSLRKGILSVLISSFIISIAGYLFINEIIQLPIDANNYVKSTTSWVTLLMATTVMPFVIIQSIASFQYATISLLKEVDRQRLLIEN